MSETVRILIIEDEDNIRKLLTFDLKHSGYDVTSTADGREGLVLALNNDFEVILIDWMLPSLSGLEIVKQLRAKGNQSLLIMVTAKDDEMDILECFEAGVDDYITKPFSPRELQARLKAHLRRFEPSSKALEVFDNLTIDRHLYEVKIDYELINLTKKEYDLLLYLIEHKNQVMSREQIITDVWDFDYDGDTRLVDVHIFNLRSKIVQSPLQIETLRGVGYVLKI